MYVTPDDATAYLGSRPWVVLSQSQSQQHLVRQVSHHHTVTLHHTVRNAEPQPLPRKSLPGRAAAWP